MDPGLPGRDSRTMTAIEDTQDPHANDAAPYAGGDPYADYRTGDFPFADDPSLWGVLELVK